MFGTDIADNFANRIFEVFSSHKDYITLSEYLKYIDVYHYGNKVERCKYIDWSLEILIVGLSTFFVFI